jgi:carbonic anhydrase
VAGAARYGPVFEAKGGSDSIGMPLQCEFLVVHCIDYRLQGYLNKWLESYIPTQSYDRVSIAGGVSDLDYVIRQVGIALRLHKINTVVLINHEECGAYGEAGNYERHKSDLEDAERKIEALFPDLDVETYYLHLDGEFEQMSKTNR